MDLITFKFFCINIRKVAWILENPCPHELIRNTLAGEYRITLLWGVLSWIKYIIEVDSSRMRRLCWSCMPSDAAEPSRGLPFQFSTGRSWEESTSHVIIVITECKGCFSYLDLFCTEISLSTRSLHALGGIRKKQESSVLWRGPENIKPARISD